VLKSFFGGSVYILLDHWAICDIYDWRCHHDLYLCIYAKSRASNGYEDGLTGGTLASVIISLRLYSIKAAAHATDHSFYLSLKIIPPWTLQIVSRKYTNYELDA
jgi:hypothetical protein